MVSLSSLPSSESCGILKGCPALETGIGSETGQKFDEHAFSIKALGPMCRAHSSRPSSEGSWPLPPEHPNNPRPGGMFLALTVQMSSIRFNSGASHGLTSSQYHDTTKRHHEPMPCVLRCAMKNQREDHGSKAPATFSSESSVQLHR